MDELKQAAYAALKDYLALKQDETLLIVSDETKREISLSLLEAGKQIAKEAFLIEMKSRELNGQEPPKQIAELMKKVDVVVCPTEKSLTHTNARREAVKAGVRVGTMPGITKETLLRCLSADADTIKKLSAYIADKLKGVNTIRVKSAKGTDIFMPVKDRLILQSTGVLPNKGDWGNMPSGEVYLAPVENTSKGRIVIDGSMAAIGLLDEPITVDVVDGYAVNISGGEAAAKLTAMLDKAGRDARAVAEFGLGTNYKAILTGQILEDEKVYGTIHIAFGNNLSMGGSIGIGIHLDGLVCQPDVYFDNEMIMKEGKLLNYEF
ncbi:MAG: aminopeptidase [Bacteroidales bacterium]|nr:aminopeptidase [Bacteroidales bacterium]